MVRRFTVNCDFGGQQSPFDVYIGLPRTGNHPLHHQSDWLSKERGGVIPTSVMDSFSNLLKLSEENGVVFEDLCAYALEESKKNEAQAVEEQQEQPQG